MIDVDIINSKNPEGHAVSSTSTGNATITVKTSPENENRNRLEDNGSGIIVVAGDDTHAEATAEVVIENTNIGNKDADGKGDAIDVTATAKASVTVTNADLTKNLDGIDVDSTSDAVVITLDNVDIEENKGEAINANAKTSATIKVNTNDLDAQNRFNGNASGITVASGTTTDITINRLGIDGNTGDAVNVSAGAKATVDLDIVTINNNGGDAINVTGTSDAVVITLDDVDITGNKGTAVEAHAGTSVTIDVNQNDPNANNEFSENGNGITVEAGTTTDITIDRLGIKDNADNASSGIHNVSGTGANITLTDVTITNNNAEAIYSKDGGNVNIVLTDVTITNNRGTGVWSEATGTSSITVTSATLTTEQRSQLSNNNGTNGGAIYNNGAVGSSITIDSHTLISNNTAENGAGIYAVNSVVTINNSTVVDNTATGDGGALYMKNGSLDLVNFTMARNQAKRGGALYADNVTIRMSDVTVAGNIASEEAGGLYHLGNTNVELYNTLIYANYAGTVASDIIMESENLSVVYSIYGAISTNGSEPNGGQFTNVHSMQLMASADNVASVFASTELRSGCLIPVISSDGMTIAIHEHGYAAHQGTLLADVDGVRYFYNIGTGKWMNLENDTTYNFNPQNENYGLPTNATVFTTAQNWTEDEQGNLTPMLRTYTTDRFNVGAYALKNTTEDISIVVTTLMDKIDVWDGVVSLREAFINAARLATAESIDRLEITFADHLFVDENGNLLDNVQLSVEDSINQYTFILDSVLGGHELIINGGDQRTVTIVAANDHGEGYRILEADDESVDWDLAFKNVIFQGNGTTKGDGAAIYVNGKNANVSFENVTVQGFHSDELNNRRDDSQAGNAAININVAEDANISIDNTTIANNTAKGLGSALSVTANNIDAMIINTTIHGNTTESDNAGIYFEASGKTNLTVLNSIIYGNYGVNAESGAFIESDITFAGDAIQTFKSAYSIYGNMNMSEDATVVSAYSQHFTDTTVKETGKNLLSLFVDVVKDENGNYIAKTDGTTVAISNTGKAAYLGTLLGELEGDYYYYDQASQEWASFTSEATYKFDAYDIHDNTPTYGLYILKTDENTGEKVRFDGTVHLTAENKQRAEDGFEYVARNYTLQSFNMGAHALNENYVQSASLVVDVIGDSANAFDSVTTLREAMANAARLAANNPNEATTYTITFANRIFDSHGNATIVLDDFQESIQLDSILTNNSLVIDGGAGRTVTIKVAVTANEATENNPASDYRIIEVNNNYATLYEKPIIIDLALKNIALEGGDLSVSNADGGLILLEGNEVSLSLSNVSMNNTVATNGGAIAIATNEYITINEVGETVHQYGNVALDLANVTINNTQATANGGAIAITTNAKTDNADTLETESRGSVSIALNNTTIKNTQAGANGGAIAITANVDIAVTDETEPSSSTAHGNISLDVHNTNIVNNTATGKGGAIYVTATVNNPDVDPNNPLPTPQATAQHGDIVINLNNITVAHNNAGEQGGAIYAEATTTNSIDSTDPNTAYGNISFTTLNTTIAGNNSTVNGGAVSLYSHNKNDITILNTTITSNTANYSVDTENNITSSTGGAINTAATTNKIIILNSIVLGNYTYNATTGRYVANDINTEAPERPENAPAVTSRTNLYVAYSIYGNISTHTPTTQNTKSVKVYGNPNTAMRQVFAKTTLDENGNRVAVLSDDNTAKLNISGPAATSGTKIGIAVTTDANGNTVETPYYYNRSNHTWRDIVTNQTISAKALTIINLDQHGNNRFINPEAGYSMGALNILEPPVEPNNNNNIYEPVDIFKIQGIYELIKWDPIDIDNDGINRRRKWWSLGTMLFPDTLSFSVLGFSNMSKYYALASGMDLFLKKRAFSTFTHVVTGIPVDTETSLLDANDTQVEPNMAITPETAKPTTPLEYGDSKLLDLTQNDTQQTELPTVQQTELPTVQQTLIAVNATNTTDMTIAPSRVTSTKFLHLLDTRQAKHDARYEIDEQAHMPEQEIVRILSMPHKSRKFQSDYERILSDLQTSLI